MPTANVAYGWGLNGPFDGGGLIGDKTTTDRSSPALVVGNHSFSQLGKGYEATIALKPNGQAWTWGDNTNGQLADGGSGDRSSPVLVVGNHSFIQVAVGGAATSAPRGVFAALKANGEVWTWGQSAAGALGDNDGTTFRSSPVLVVGNHSFIQVDVAHGSLNGGNVCAMAARKANGEVWTWGHNSRGILGDNTTTNRSSPVLVVGNHSFIAVSMGGGTTLGALGFMAALKANGQVWTWGSGGGGALGDNTAANKSSPVLVVGNHSFLAVSCGGTHTIALKADGSVWAWGDNTAGGLGDNSTTNRSSPVLVVGAHSFVEISCGYQYSAARKADGTIWTWGVNTAGQLGDNSTTSRSSPVLVVGGFSFTQIAAGDSFMHAIVGSVATGWGPLLAMQRNRLVRTV